MTGLNGILEDVENGTLEITDKYEDIHSFVEANLIDRLGDRKEASYRTKQKRPGCTGYELYTRDEDIELDGLLKEILEVLLK